MDTTHVITVKRQANVSRKDALEALVTKYPVADVLSFSKKGSQYVATLRFSGDEPVEEEPPAKEEPVDEAAPEKDDEMPESDDESSVDGPVDGPVGEGEMPKKQNPEEEMVTLLREILHALKGGGGGHPDDMDAMADVGAPPSHGHLPPPPGGGGGLGGGGGAPPLPPPVQKKAPGMAGAFASVKIVRPDAHELTINEAAHEARLAYPGYRVARIAHDQNQNAYQAILVRG